MVSRRLAGAATALWGACVAACLPPPVGVPLNEPVFPKGVAVTKNLDHLIVVSSDFDSKFTDDAGHPIGALLSANLTRARAAAAGARNGAINTLSGDYTSAVLIPAFADRPQLSPNGDRVFVPIGGVNQIASIDVAADGGLSCGDTHTPQLCADNSRSFQLPRNDPFAIIMLGEDDPNGPNAGRGRVSAMATLLSSSEVFFFHDDAGAVGAKRMVQDGVLDLGSATFAGVRAAVLRPQKNGSPATVFAAADLGSTTVTQTTTDPLTGQPITTAIVGAQILAFQPQTNTDVVPFDVTAATGALSMRDMVLIEAKATDPPGTPDAIVGILRPVGFSCCDAIARFEIHDDAALPSLTLAGIQETCKAPTTLKYSSSIDRVLVACNGDNAVQAVDPVTLAPMDAVRSNDSGRGPYAIDVDDVNHVAYVSFFLDNSVGVLSLVDAANAPKLTFKARIGEQAPKPEDGRE